MQCNEELHQMHIYHVTLAITAFVYLPNCTESQALPMGAWQIWR